MAHNTLTYVAKTPAPHAVPGHSRARKAERFRLKRGFVALSSSNFCEIRNISKKGLGLEYLAHQGSPCDALEEISIINNLEAFLLGQISCRIVYVNDIVPTGQQGKSVIRRVGLEFINLSSDQQDQIDDLITKFSMENDTIH